jgi:hypothetical protein
MARFRAGQGAGTRQLRDDLDDVSTSFGIFEGDEVLGSIRLTLVDDLPDPSALYPKLGFEDAIDAFGIQALCLTSRFIVDQRARGGTAMLRMMTACFDMASSRGVRLNYGDCSPALLRFYEDMGFRRYRRPYNDPVDGFTLPTVMPMHDRAHLALVRSPLHRAALNYPDDRAVRDWFDASFTDYAARERPERDLAAASRLFGRLPPAELEALLSKGSVFRAYPGDVVMRAAERTGATFIVIEGTLRCGSEVPDATLLHTGDLFGDLFGNAAEAVTATTCADLLVLPAEDLERCLAMRATAEVIRA